MGRILGSLALLVVLGLALAGPEDNSLIIGTSQEPVLLASDPLNTVTSQAIKSEVELYLMDGLYRQDLDAQLQPVLVTEVATVENGRLVISQNAEGENVAEINLTLRDDVTWSDGTPITTADIQFYYDLGKTPGMPVAGPDYWARVGLTVQDERNFTVSFEPAQSSDLVGSPIGLLPVHVMGAAWEDVRASTEGLSPETDAERLAETFRGYFTEFGSPDAVNAGRMVYSGPFVPVRWAVGSSLEMERNPNYFDHPENQDAYVQTVRYNFITDTNALLFSIVSGAVDATSSVSITFDQALSPQIQARAADRYRIWFVPGAIWEHIDVNQFTNVQQVADLQLDDVRTRRALLYAMDRESMADALFQGLQPVAHANVSPFDPSYNPDVPQYNYDPERARELLTELGWTPGPDGILQRTTADGRTVRFEIEFVTTAGNAVRERQQQFIAEDLRQVGIEARINNAPSNVVFAADFSSRAYEGAWTGMFMFAWISSQASTLNAEGYLCRSAPRPENNFAGQNYGGACSPEFDALRDQAVRELDFEVARPIYQEMQRIFAEEVISLPLFYRTTPYVVANGLVNYVTSTFNNGFGYPPTQPQFVGWEQRGAEQMFDQADYALSQE
jgi:peptide/nickel transport system substrate-binding protein